MATDYSVFGTPALVPDDLADANSVTAAYAASAYRASPIDPTPRGGILDPDTDPTGVKTRDFLVSRGEQGTTQSILTVRLANGNQVSREWLMERPEGQRLLSIMHDNRVGHKRGFLDSISDLGVNDLPFMTLIGTQAGSISAAVRVSDALKKMQNGEKLSDEEALSVTLYNTEAKWKSEGSWGSKVGDIIRAAPGFMLEFLSTGGMGGAARSGAAKVAKESIHIGMTRAAKTAARELVEAGAKRELAAEAAGAAVKLTAESGAGKKVVEEVTTALLNPRNGLIRNNPLYKGMSEDALERLARNRAMYELGQFTARTSGGKVANSLVSTGQWLRRHVSQGLLDYGSWGTEEAVAAFSNRSTAGRALSDAIGTFFVEAPIKGAMMYAPNAFVAKPLIGAAFSEDGRVVSEAQLGLEHAAYLTGNRELMDRAESIAFGMNLLEYVSENAGRGFSSLVRAAGLGIEKAVARAAGELPIHLVTPAMRAINRTGDILVADSAITVGGKMREMIGKVLGTREEFLRKVQGDEFRVAAKALGISGNAEEIALRKALLSRNTADLPRRVASAAGADFEKFMTNAMKGAYDDEFKNLAYKNFAQFAMANYMAKHNIGPESVMNLFEKMGYDGILGEMFEERYSDVAKGLFGLDDRKTHDFMSNLKEAVKGLYPGFDQLTAEAVGFAFPLVTRAMTMRAVSAIGGGGKVAELRERLDAMDDAFRIPIVSQVTPGQYFSAYEKVSADLARRIEETRAEVQAERSAGNEDAALGLENQLKTMETEAARRAERHEKITGLVNVKVSEELARQRDEAMRRLETARTSGDATAIAEAEADLASVTDLASRSTERVEKSVASMPTTEELARVNASLMLNIPQLTEEQYRADEAEFNRNILPTLDQVGQSVAAQEALVDFAAELGEQLDAMANPKSSDTSVGWLRSAAQKIVGFAGSVVTGDFSLMSVNPAKYVARDLGLSKYVCDKLQKAYHDEWMRQKKVAEDAYPYASIEEINEAARSKFAPTAARIMKSALLSSQIRAFSQTDILDQAIGQVAREQGYSVDTAGQRLVKFVDGKFDESTAVSFSDFRERNADAVSSMRDEIAVATVDLLTTKLTTATDRRALMNAIRLPASSEIANAAVYELAMRMVGLSGITREQRLGTNPIEVDLNASAIGRVNQDVASYVATRRAAGQKVDDMAYASLADSLGLSYDGTENGLTERNAKIDTICDLLEFGRDPTRVVLSKEVAYDKADIRFQRSHSVNLFGRMESDGRIRIVRGYDENGVEVSDIKTAEEWKRDGYVRVEPRVVITQRQNLWTDDMYEMLRQLGELGAYRASLGEKNEDLHPMLRTYSEREIGDFLAAHPELNGQSADNIHEAIARDTLRREMALADNAIPVDATGTTFDVPEIPAGRTRQEVEAMWKKLYDPKTGYMKKGEAILTRRGVTIGDPVSMLAGSRAGQYQRRRYNFNIKAGGGTVASADHFIPIDVANGEDFVTGILASHLGRAYSTHARLLSDSLRGAWSDFTRGVDAIIERRLVADDLSDDDRAELRRLQGMVTQVDRTVVDAEGNARTYRGVGLTQQAFVELASTFALFQDVRTDENGLVNSISGRALKAVATEARMLPSWTGFLNVVDLTLGGNGFLSEYLRNGKKSDGSDLRGIRRLLQIVGGSADAFAEAVKTSLPGGRSYRDFLGDCVAAATAMARNPVSVVKPKEISTKDREELEEISARPDTPSKHFDYFGKLAQAVGLEGADLTAFLTEAVRQSSDSMARGTIASTELAERLSKKETAVVNATVRLIKSERGLRELNEKIATEARKVRDLEAQGKDTTASAETLNKLRDEASEVNATVRALQEERAKALEAAAAVRSGEKTGESLSPAALFRQNPVVTSPAPTPVTEFDEAEDEGEDPTFSIRLLPTDLDRDLNDLFKQQVDNRIQAEQHVLMQEDARLAVNVTVRATISASSTTGNEGTVSESTFLKTFDTMFPGTATEDRAYVLQEFRTANARRELEGRTWDELTTGGAKWGFETNDREEDDVSDVSFNRAAVNEYNSDALSTFLAVAQLSSPETGRNFQAFATSVREVTRDCNARAETDGLTKEASDALTFLDRLMNPRADKVGRTFNERKARYDKFVAEAMSDTDRVRAIVNALLTGGADGKPVSRKGALLVSYLSSLETNVRLNFTDLISSSSVTSPVEVVREKGRWNARSAVRPDYSVPVEVVYGVMSPFVGMTSERLRQVTSGIRSAVKDTSKLRALPSTNAAGSIRSVMTNNFRVIADALVPFFGRESVVYACLTSPVALRHRVQSAEVEGSLGTLGKMIASTLPRKDGKIELLESLASVLEATAESGKVATRGLLWSNAVSMFATGNLSEGGVTMAPSTAEKTDVWNTIVATYEDAQPKTIMHARVDTRRDGDGAIPSIAIASRGVVPLVSRFMDTEFDRIVKARFPDATDDDIAQCRQDMTWPDPARTPIVAKNISKSYNAEEVLHACANSFVTSAGNMWIPVYAGDHSSAIMIQVPKVIADGAREATKTTSRAEGMSDEEYNLARYKRFATSVCRAIGLNLLGDDTKRSALSSLEAVGTSTIGIKSENPDGSVEYGENRIHIVYNYTLRDMCRKDNESLFGTTMVVGYGAEQQRLRASSEDTATLKVHAISTSGAELAFIKSLAVSPTGAENRGEFPEDSAPGTLFNYLLSRLGNDGAHSTHILTDKDSYKIGVAGTKQVTIEGKKVMDWLFAKLEAKAKLGSFSMTSEDLDAEFGEVDVDFKLKGGVKKTKLSALLPGIDIRTVDGLNGPTVDISFREDGMTFYSVANVSHDSNTVDNRTPRNHEIDAMTMATYLTRNNFVSNTTSCDRVFDLISNWGLAAAALNSNEDVIRHIAETSSGVEEKRRYGEASTGQNNREEIARSLWSQLRKANNIPLRSIDAPLVSAGAEITKDGKGVYYYGKSRMYAAMMVGSQVFTKEEQAFYGTKRRFALCNANCTDASFRYGWFLDEEKFSAKYGVTGDEAVLRKLEELFTELKYGNAADKSALRTELTSCFKDHHGKHISEKTIAGRMYSDYVSFEDLFMQGAARGDDRIFDRSAVQIGSDRVYNDATGESHIFLGGTAFGLPRTPSYNGSMWLQVVRAGLPVTERTITNLDGTTDFAPGRDACVSPDPFTNKILGCDHDGDKTKMYMFAAQRGVVDFENPPSVSLDTESFDRKAHFDALYSQGWFDRKYVDENGNIAKAKLGDPHREGEWYEMNPVARNWVSNSFVQCLFDMARDLPCKEATNERQQFADGPVSKHTKATPLVEDEKGNCPDIDELLATVGGPEILTEGVNLGDPVPGAQVSKRATDAASARAMVVSLASTLHLAWTDGRFQDTLFRGLPQDKWVDFMYLFDGLSNATFDDIKSQKCSRLGWTSNMMDSLVTAMLLNNGKPHPPTTSAEMKEVLREFARGIFKEKNQLFFMSRVSDKSDYTMRTWVTQAFGANPDRGIYKGDLMRFFNLEEVTTQSGNLMVIRKAPRDVKSATVGEAIAWALDSIDKRSLDKKSFISLLSSAGFSSPSASVRLGYLAYLTAVASGVSFKGINGKSYNEAISKVRLDLTDPVTVKRLVDVLTQFKTFENMRGTLAEAKSFAQSINYLNADAGNESQASQYKELKDNFNKDSGRSTRLGHLRKMHAATMATYDVGYRLTTLAVDARRELAKVKETMADIEEKGTDSERETIAALRSLGKEDSGLLNSWRDRNAIEANKQMVVYILSQLRMFNDGEGPFTDPVTAFDTFAKAGELTAHGPSKILSMRYGIEAAFDLMYRLAASSTESLDNNVFSYFRLADDSKYSNGYLGSGKGLRRIRPAFRGGTDESQRVVQALVRDVAEGRSFTSERKLRFGRKSAAAKSFSLTVENIDAMLTEAVGHDASLQRSAEAVKKMLPAFGGEITPAMLFGKILPMYTVVTERTLGAPDPRSSSLLGLLGGYAKLSESQVKLTDHIGDLIGVIGAHNLAPVQRVRVMPSEDGTTEDEDVRTNPDYRHTVDIFTPRNPFRSAVKAATETRRDTGSNSPGSSLGDLLRDPVGAQDSNFARGKDPSVERIANAMRALVGTWAHVEYKGGSTFTIFGDLKGDLAVTKKGKPVRAVIAVNVGDFLNTEAEVEHLANSRSYAASLVSGLKLGISADEFLNLLPLKTRKEFVKRFGVGGFSSNKVAWSVTGDTIATALNVRSADTTVYHEYFHSMMRMFDALGVLADEDVKALAEKFGPAPHGTGWKFDEEAAAEAFRAWVKTNESQGATEVSGVFTKIKEFLVGLWEALKAGFSFGEEEPADETLFKMVVSGIAEGSRERKALGEVAAAVKLSRGAKTIRELAEESLANLSAEAQAVGSTESMETFAEDHLHGDEYDAALKTVNSLLDRGRINKSRLVDAVRAAVEAGRPLAEARGINITEHVPGATSVETADPMFSLAEPGTEENGIQRTQVAVKLATVPLVETSMFYRTAYNITRAIEDGLKGEGSWRGELAQAIEMQKDYNRRSNGVELADKDIVIRALRQAISVVNPGLKVPRKELEGSLAFEAALVMSAKLTSAFVRPAPAGAKASEYLHPGETERERKAKQKASAYDISGWLLSSRAVLPGDAAENAIMTLKELPVAGDGARTVFDRCISALERVSAACGDPTMTANWVGGGSNAVLNEVLPSIEAGLKKITFDDEGFENDYELEDGETDNPYAKENYKLYSQCLPSVQHALKVTLSTLHQVAAMDKFYRETGVVPGGFEDIEACKTFARRGIPDAVSPAEWAASQAIGPSNMADNASLVDFQNQSGFIAANAESWIMSQIRTSFGKAPLRDRVMAEASEYAAIKSEIMHVENMQSFRLGDNVDAGGRLLEVIEHDNRFEMEDGFVRYIGEKGGKSLGFDNLRRRTVNVSFTVDELRTVDLFKKMLSAYANGQKVMLTGVNRLTFNESMDTDPEWYSWEKLEKRWNNAKPGSQFTRMELACVRIMRQLQIEGVTGKANGTLDIYNRFVNEVCSALRKAMDEKLRLPKNERADFNFNDAVLRVLRGRGIVAAQRSSDGKTFRQGTLVLPVDAVDRMFKASSAYDKLVNKAGRKPEWISKETLTAELLAVHRKAMDFVKRHPWITEGDARYLNSFKTPVMFFSGSGMFMHDAIRVSRDRKLQRTESVPRYVNAYRAACQSKNALEPLTQRDIDLLDVVSDVYGTGEQGVDLLDAINRGDYAKGSPKSDKTGLELPANAAHAEVAEAVYHRLMDLAWQEQTSGGKLRTGVRSIEEMIEAYEEERESAASFAVGGMGIDDVTMFERYGILPANYQLGHKIHQAVDQVTNAMMMRNTLVNMLTTPAADGSPTYLVRPDDIVREEKGKSVPDELWSELARWWADFYGLKYDESKDGIANAQRLYDEITAAGKRQSGTTKLRLRATVPDSDDHQYTALGEDENDLVSMRGWYAIDDGDRGEESSYLNAIQGGEALGYLRQVVQAGRVPGLGSTATRQTLQRALSWSKSLSVSFSLFFPWATRFESPVGAVGATATLFGNTAAGSRFLREHSDLMNGIQKLMPGSGWITKDFLGYNDIVQMMDTNDPFLAELKSWAAALGITISDRLMNPMEPTKSLVIEDLKRMKRMLRDKFGEKFAAQFGNVTDALLVRQGEKSFAYALNATKLAVVAQMCSKLRYEAAKRGKAFDPVRDLRKYSGYINAEVGGIDPFSYAWATPRVRNLMNVMMFSWQWTRGAWEAGGGKIIEDLVFGGHTMTRQERKYMIGRWARMWCEIMIGIPAMMQIACKALGLAMGWDDDDDYWFAHLNEGKVGASAFDLTPLLRGMERFDDTVLGGLLRAYKTGGAGPTALVGAGLGAFLGGRGAGWLGGIVGSGLGAAAGSLAPSMIPMYTGEDPANQKTQRRRYYMHFGKQGWEFFRWFTDPGQQFFSKLSMPVQRSLEGLLGYNPSYPGHELPWEDKGALERWLDPTTDGATFNLMKAFLPFSVSSVSEFGDTGLLPIFGPVSMGASETAIQDRLVKAISAWATDDRSAYRWSAPQRGKKVKPNYSLVSDILADARRNGLDPDEQYVRAVGQITPRLYSRLFSLIPENPGDSYDVREVSKVVRALNKLGSRKTAALQAIKKRLDARGKNWTRVLSPEQRAMIRSIVGETMKRPFDDTDVVRRDEY